MKLFKIILKLYILIYIIVILNQLKHLYRNDSTLHILKIYNYLKYKFK